MGCGRQRHKDKNKLWALHAPEPECIGKGKARQPSEFDVKVSLAITHQHGLMVGTRSFRRQPTRRPYAGRADRPDQSLLQDIGVRPTTAMVDLGYRGIDKDLAPVEVSHRRKFRSLTTKQKTWLKRRQAIGPLIGHTKATTAWSRCWLKDADGDDPSLQPTCCEAPTVSARG